MKVLPILFYCFAAFGFAMSPCERGRVALASLTPPSQWKVDTKSNSVDINGTIFSLQKSEARVLAFLLENIGRAISFEDIGRVLFTRIKVPKDGYVGERIGKIVRKIGDCGKLIEAVHGYGYRVYETFDEKQMRLQTQKFDVIENSRFSLDVYAQLFEVDGLELYLTATQFRLMKFFMLNAHKSLTLGEIGEALGMSAVDDAENIKAHISNLRQKLKTADANYIYNVEHFTYQFSPP